MQRIATTPNFHLTERDLKAIELRYLGKSSKEIAEVTDWNESHVRRLFMRGGRLEAAYEAYAHKQQGLAQAKAESVLERAKQEAQSAIERMVELSKDPGNGPVCYKANEYLLGLAGASTEASLRGLLQKLSFEEAKKRVNETFTELYGRTVDQVQKFDEQDRQELIQRLARYFKSITCSKCQDHVVLYCRQCEKIVEFAEDKRGSDSSATG